MAAGHFHGVALAELVSAKDVLVPLAPGITAAMGLLGTNLQYEHIRPVITNLYSADQPAMDKVNAVVETLIAAGNLDLDADTIPAPERHFEVIAEVRDHGQGFELRVPIPGGRLTEGNRVEVITAFHARPTADYGYAFDDALVELYNIRVIAAAAAPICNCPKSSGAARLTFQPRTGVFSLQPVDGLFRNHAAPTDFGDPRWRIPGRGLALPSATL